MSKYQDFPVGKCYIQKKPNGDETKLMAVMVYEFDQNTGAVKSTGTKKITYTDKKTGQKVTKEVEQHKIAYVLHIAQSSLVKVGSGETNSCNVYFTKVN